MAYKKDKSPKERVNRKEVRDSNAKALEDRKKESARLRGQYANKPGYDSAGNKLDEKEKLRIKGKSITEDLEKGIDLEKLREEGTPGIDPLYSTSMSPEMQETYKNNPGYPKFNEETKRVVEGTKRGSKERLKGLKENIGNYGRLAIKNANPTGIVVPILTGAASLMIKSYKVKY